MRVRPQHVQDAASWPVVMVSTATIFSTATVLGPAALVAMANARVVSLMFGLPPVRITHVTQDAPLVALQHIDND